MANIRTFVNFKTTVSRIRKLNADLLSENALTNAINKGIRRSLEHMAYYAKRHHKYKDWLERARKDFRGNGKGLTRAIHYRTKKGSKGSVQTGELYIRVSEAPWAVYQYYGTKGHGAKVARALVFFGRGNSNSNEYPTKDKVVTKYVKGIEADPFLEDALEYYRKDTSMWIEDEIRKAVSKNA